MSVEIQNTVQDIFEDLELQLCKLGLAMYGGAMKDGFDNDFVNDVCKASTSTKIQMQ